MKKFPNGFASWQETHYEVVTAINNNCSAEDMSEVFFEYADCVEKRKVNIINRALREKGHGGLYELAEELTDEFESLNKGREWDGEFFEEIERFLDEKFK
jgi:hypothetical protein